MEELNNLADFFPNTFCMLTWYSYCQEQFLYFCCCPFLFPVCWSNYLFNQTIVVTFFQYIYEVYEKFAPFFSSESFRAKWLIYFKFVKLFPSKTCFECRWLFLAAHGKQKDYCYPAFVIQTLLSFLNLRYLLNVSWIGSFICTDLFLMIFSTKTVNVPWKFSGFTVWQWKKFLRMIICCLYLRQR